MTSNRRNTLTAVGAKDSSTQNAVMLTINLKSKGLINCAINFFHKFGKQNPLSNSHNDEWK